MIVIEPAEKYSFAAQRDNGSASRVPAEKMACWKGLRVVEFSLHGIDPIFFFLSRDFASPFQKPRRGEYFEHW